MTSPIGDCLIIKPEEKNGRLYLPDIEGSPIRLDVEGLEKRGVIESVKYFKVDETRKNFAVRAAY